MKNIFSSKLKTDSFTDLISSGMVVNGDITFNGVLKIEGLVNGKHILSLMFVGDEASIKADTSCVYVAPGGGLASKEVKSYDIIIGGLCSSDILWAENTMRILKTAQISKATIYYRELEIEPGAKLLNCQMKHLDYCSEGEQV